jgi:hypothetical protein
MKNERGHESAGVGRTLLSAAFDLDSDRRFANRNRRHPVAFTRKMLDTSPHHFRLKGEEL